MVRLQKYMADAGIASRRACEELILAGRVAVNGATATLGMSVGDGDTVSMDGKPVERAQEKVAVILYKPRGVVSTSSDPEGRKTVQAFVDDLPQRLYNVGRLDINSEGLLLLTNDGDLAYRLTHPKFRVEKTYYAVCDGVLTPTQSAKLINGVQLEDGMTAPAKVRNIRSTQTGGTSFEITIHEGRNRQIRRMIEAVEHRTLRLRRERFGPLLLGELKPGERRVLSRKELADLHAWLDAAEKRR